MSLLNKLKRELENALREASAASAKQAAAPKPPIAARPVVEAPNWPRPGRKIDQQRASDARKAAREQARNPIAGAPAQRVAGRLYRESLMRMAPGPSSMPTAAAAAAEPTTEDFRRKVEAMTSAELSLPAFDLAPDEAAPPEAEPLTFTPRDILRAFVLGEVMDEPKGRRCCAAPGRPRRFR